MNKTGLNVFDVLYKGRKIDMWSTPTTDLAAATAEAIDMLGLPPQVMLVLRKPSKRGTT